jgi:hypothetical protein
MVQHSFIGNTGDMLKTFKSVSDLVIFVGIVLTGYVLLSVYIDRVKCH